MSTALQVRFDSAAIRRSATRLRASIDNALGMAEAVADPRKRELLRRAADVILKSFAVREAADRLPQQTGNDAELRLAAIQESAALIGSAVAHIKQLDDAHVFSGYYHEPLSLAQVVAQWCAFAEPLTKGQRVKLVQTPAKIVKTKAADGAPMISGIASSTAVDLTGDRFAPSALKEMRAAYPGRSLWLDHSYKAAEDLAGRITEAHIVKSGDEHDLIISAVVNVENARAMQAYRSLKSGMALDFSVGVIVVEQEKTNELYHGKPVWSITKTIPLEVSVVGIGAQPRAHITGAKHIDRELAEMYART